MGRCEHRPYNYIIAFKNSSELNSSKSLIFLKTPGNLVSKVERLSLVNYGGIRYFKCNVVLSEGITMIDINSFVIMLQDYLLKVADVAKIDLIDPNSKPKHVKVRSLKEDARNSRSRNSKTNAKKKNSTKKNKKR